MRPKVVFPILLLAAVVLAVVFVSKKSHPQTAAAPAASATPVAVAAPAPKPSVAIVAPAPAIVANNAGTNSAAAQKLAHEEYVQKRSDEMMELAMQKDPAAHQQIVDELKNSDRQIRKAALDALEQANDRSVVPQMQQIADQTDDPDDKQAIEDAIDFINLPSLTEFLQQRKAQKAAQGNQTPSPTPQNNQSGQ